jgi:hypothetical protein
MTSQGNAVAPSNTMEGDVQVVDFPQGAEEAPYTRP